MAELLVAPCSPAAASYAVQHWHYSHRMPAPPHARYGVWEGGRFVGAIVFSPGGSGSLLRSFGIDSRAVTELTRVALRDHSAPVSQMVKLAVRQLHRDSPGIELVISFADPYYGHHGGIYQASNWLYLGVTDTQTIYRDTMTGRLYHNRVTSPSGWRKQFGVRKKVRTTASLVAVPVPGKHRYALPLTRSLRRKLSARALPYPAAEVSTADTPGLLPGGAGSTPASRSDGPRVALADS